MEKKDFPDELKNLQNGGTTNREAKREAMLEQVKEQAKAARKKALRVGLTILVLVLGLIGGVFYMSARSYRFDGLLYLTDKTGKPSIWIHTRQYMRVKNSNQHTMYCLQRNSLHIIDPLTSRESPEILLPASLFSNSRQWMVLHANQVWFIKPAESGPWTDVPEATIVRLDPSNGHVLSKTENFIHEHPQLQGGIKNLSYYAESQEITFETKDGLNFRYSFRNDSLLAEPVRYTGVSVRQGAYFALSEEALSGNSHRKMLQVIHPRKQDASWTFNRHVLDAIPEKCDSGIVKQRLGENKIYIDGKILAQQGSHVLIMHATEIGDDGNIMLSCVDELGKTLWTLTQTEVPLLGTMNRQHKESFFAGPGQIRDNATAQVQDKQFILSLDLAGACAVDISTGALKWSFKNAYNSRY